MGGWTSLASAFGDQDVFKATLAFDPGYNCDLDELAGNQYKVTTPVCVVMSSQFVPVNLTQFFGLGENAAKGYKNLQTNCAHNNPHAQNGVQFVTIGNSSHTDQGDVMMYSMWEGTLMNSFMFKCQSGTKKEGTQTEFHEFLGCVWLEFLLKQGLHDSTFQLSNIIVRLRQF